MDRDKAKGIVDQKFVTVNVVVCFARFLQSCTTSNLVFKVPPYVNRDKI